MDFNASFINDVRMVHFIFIFACLFFGLAFRRSGIFPESTAVVLNRFVIYISLPALTLKVLHQVALGVEHLPAIAMSWLIFGFGCLFFLLLAKPLRLSRANLGTLILLGGLGNTSFVGFPILEALFGSQAISTGVLVDQPGTFLVCGTLGIIAACIFSARAASPLEIARKILLFPPFQAVVAGIVLRPFHYPEWLDGGLDRLAATMIPLSLVAVGFQLNFNRTRLQQNWRELFFGLLFKMLLAPLIVALLYVGVFRLRGENIQIILVESAMAPMITAGIIVTEYGLNAELASQMIGVGIPLAIILSPLVFFFAKMIC